MIFHKKVIKTKYKIINKSRAKLQNFKLKFSKKYKNKYN